MENNKSYEQYLEGTAQILEESREEEGKYMIELLDKEFVVYPEVFSPKYFKDTKFFAENISVETGEDFLEIGSGSGVVSIEAADQGANVTATDINPKAVENTKENVRLNNLESHIEVLEGDVYEPVDDSCQFDTIFWNTPFGYVEDGDIDKLEQAVFDPNYESTKKFIFNAEDYLKPDGRLLIGFSTTLGKFEILKDFLEEAGYEVNLLAKTESEETHPVYFELFEAVQEG